MSTLFSVEDKHEKFHHPLRKMIKEINQAYHYRHLILEMTKLDVPTIIIA